MMTDEQFLTRNRDVIAAFRAAGGLTEPFPILLLTTTGARTGMPRTNPLGYCVDRSAGPAGRVFVVASRAGTPRDPAWFHNLRAEPQVVVELGGTHRAKAVVAEGAERDRLFALAAAANPLYEQYEAQTSRVFPVVVLDGVPVPQDR